MSKAQWKDVQRECNRWTNKFLRGFAPLRVDGVPGHATKVRIQWIKYYCGYGAHRNKLSSEWTHLLVTSMRAPHSLKANQSRRQMRVGRARRVRQRARHHQQHVIATISPGVTRFDGVPCAKWLAVKLQKARSSGIWHGHLNSGWRSPSYSRSLCRRICGRDFCPGRCAGTSSNHAGSSYPRGAVDVSDYVAFGIACRRLGLGIHNALGAQDPVHFSRSGR